jgi:hypothetical protein
MRNAVVYKAGLLNTGNNFDRVPERCLGLCHERRIFARSSNGTGARCAYAVCVDIPQALTESR